MVDLARCVLMSGSDVCLLKIRHFGKEFFGGEPFRQQVQHIRDPDAHAPNAGASAALSGIYGNPLQQVGHDSDPPNWASWQTMGFIVAQHHVNADLCWGGWASTPQRFIATAVRVLDLFRGSTGVSVQMHSELWRYRVGDYRLICELRDEVLVVLVLRVGHRSRVYRN